jgi:hypothetical protein
MQRRTWVTLILLALTFSATPSVNAGETILWIAQDEIHGYDRDLFGYWVDADKDGCDTRAEVLIQEALIKVREAMKFEIGMEELLEAALLSVDYGTGKSGKAAVIQLKGVSKEELIAKLDERLQAVPGVAYNFTQPMAMRLDETISGIKADVAVKIFGEDAAVLEQLAQVLLEPQTQAEVVAVADIAEANSMVRQVALALSSFHTQTYMRRQQLQQVHQL